MNSKSKLIASFAGGVALTLAAAVAFRARAAGVPEAEGMTYTGYLEDGAGQPLTGEHSIEVQFWASPEATDDLCTGQLDSAELQAGRFQIALPISCSDAVKASPDIWVSVDVDGASLGRTKLGTVPFALEAGHASRADTAAEAEHAATAANADGPLKEQVDDLTARAEALEAAAVTSSAFRARKTNATQPINSGAMTAVVFNTEDFDVGSEFNPTTGIFSPKASGYYQISCTVTWSVTSAGSGFYLAAVFAGGVRVLESGGRTEHEYASRSASGLVKLEAGDQVNCSGYQSTGSTLNVFGNPTEAHTRFDATRVSPL